MTRKWDGKGSRHSRGYDSRWDRIRKLVLRRDDYLCQECMRQGKLTPLCVRPYDHAVDHILSKANGGGDEMENLQAICQPCHSLKTARDEGWKQVRKVGPDGYPL